MTTCPSCGKENPDGFQFCGFCAAPLVAAPVPREQRKTVTVLFCDVTGSTSLGESTDPEALRALLARYFERMKTIVESHGGTVEKFIGDAVMAVFGVPKVHEDDALRACRAAIEMRDALPALGVQARIGVNTGEVVTGTEERLATGDAVNVAARLEQAAQPDEVLIGKTTLALVRDAVATEPAEPLALKGKTEPVAAVRLLAVHEPNERRVETPMVGRERERDRLRDAFAQASENRSCQLFTILGAAGVGKSRLAREFLADLDARVVVGRCLSYGEGITYWPVVEVVNQVDALPSHEGAAAALRSLLGESDEGTTADEIAWAFRKLLEERAQVGPLVCLFDDIHWGEETFLDLVEHIADLSRDAPILLLCLARPELLDKRPSWGGGKLNATAVLLEPLSPQETETLLDELGGAPKELRERIRTASEGNPLFVEEMLALLRESTDGEITVPPTIQALLAARLDQLDPHERSVLECGSVEGPVFHRSAVAALDPDEAELPERLVSLVRKELVRPDRAQLPGDDAFRFRHLLIRDAAYDALPKATRAELHQRFAGWLEEHAPDLVELDEILGYHLEQAARYNAALGSPHAELAERAGERLAAAGRGALWRGDIRAARELLGRAVELTQPLRLDVHLELDLSFVQETLPEILAIQESLLERARATGDEAGEGLALLAIAQTRSFMGGNPADVEAAAEAALPLLERTGDHAGIKVVWLARGQVANLEGRFEKRAQAAEQALRHSRLAGERVTHLFGLDIALAMGPRPADEALRTLDELAREAVHPHTALVRSWLLGMLGKLEEAWSTACEAGERQYELTGRYGGEAVLAEIAVMKGESAAAAKHWRPVLALLEEARDHVRLSTYAPTLGRVLCALGDYDEAERLAERGRELGDERDVWTQALWRQVRALVLASRGDRALAERLAREAVEIIDSSDMLNQQGDALCDLAEVLAAAGRTDEAFEALEQARKRYERKKNLAMVGQVRARLEELRAGVTRAP